jgi:cytochrome b561
MQMFNLTILLWSRCLSALRHLRSPRRRMAGDAGQTTAEYALMLIAAAALAVVVIGWISRTDAISKLFELVLSHVSGNVG